jgi:hypothetical protein
MRIDFLFNVHIFGLAHDNVLELTAETDAEDTRLKDMYDFALDKNFKHAIAFSASTGRNVLYLALEKENKK